MKTQCILIFSVYDTALTAPFITVFKASLAKPSTPLIVEHAEKQPRYEAPQEQNVREHSLLKVRREILLIQKFSFCAIQVTTNTV